MDILRKNRGLLIFEGVLFIIIGLLAIALPIASTFAAEQFIGWLLIIGGIFQGYRSYTHRDAPGFWTSLFSSLLNLVLGIMLIMYPVAGAISLAFLLIFFFLLQGITKIVMALQLRPRPRWGWLVFSGVLSIFMAGLIWAGWPGTAFWALGLLLGINMLFFGTSLLFFGLALPKEGDKEQMIDKKNPPN